MRKHHAFTLIELLVVVAITIALLAILMPSMNRAVEATHRAICGSNLRQVQIGHVNFATDRFGQFVVGAPQQGTLGPWAYYFATSWIGFVGNGELYEAGVIPGGHVFFCPSSTHPLHQWGNPLGWPADNDFSTLDPNARGWLDMSYYYRAAYGADEVTGSYGRLMKMSDPGASVMLSDGFGRDCYHPGSGGRALIPGGDYFHSGKGYTTARLDGSASFFDDPEGTISQVVYTWPGGNPRYRKQEKIWQEFTGGPAPVVIP